MATPQTSTEDRLKVSRTIRASRQRVFRAWTEPELMMRWFVEDDAEMSVCQIDLREGGRYRLEGNVGGKAWRIRGEYLEVRPPERLVYTWTWDHDPGFGEQTGDTLVTVEFRERGKETELVLTHERFATAKARDEHDNGWKQCLDRLSKLAEKEEEFR
ncbi:MAG: SRPBCC family protein [Thermoanaerobaculia bacterium]